MTQTARMYRPCTARYPVGDQGARGWPYEGRASRAEGETRMNVEYVVMGAITLLLLGYLLAALVRPELF